MAGLIKRAAKFGKHLVASPIAKDGAKACGGVAMLAERRAGLTACRPPSEAIRELHEAGRLMLAIMDPGIGVPVRFYNVYGWAGA
eukprot:9597618-Alexandrium_andersonii.AAC.1